MSGYSKLKALAEAAPTGPWYPPDETSHKGMVFDCDLGSLLRYESIDTERDDCVAYVAAANPAAVLELIAKVEDLVIQVRSAREVCIESQGVIQSLISERDQLKAENEALRTEAKNAAEFLKVSDVIDASIHRDSKRYRWLRAQTWNTGPLAVATYPKESIRLGFDCPFGERLDAQIDQAMSKSNG